MRPLRRPIAHAPRLMGSPRGSVWRLRFRARPSIPRWTLPMSSGRSSGLEPWSAGAPSRLIPTRTHMGPHRLPGDPSRASALLTDPGRIGRPGHHGLPDAAPALPKAKASTLAKFRGSITRLQHPLSTLHERRRRRPCKTRFRPAGSASTGGVSNPLGHFERFQIISSSFPGLRLSQWQVSGRSLAGFWQDLAGGWQVAHSRT
jgi:hypothetical protein